MDNIKEWTFLSKLELLTRASCRKDWNRISAELSLMSPSNDQTDQRTKLNGTIFSASHKITDKSLIHNSRHTVVTV